jgi:hypothetical protein
VRRFRGAFEGVDAICLLGLSPAFLDDAVLLTTPPGTSLASSQVSGLALPDPLTAGSNYLGPAPRYLPRCGVLRGRNPFRNRDHLECCERYREINKRNIVKYDVVAAAVAKAIHQWTTRLNKFRLFLHQISMVPDYLA